MADGFTLEVIRAMLDESDLEVVATHDLPQRSAVYKSIPDRLHPAIRKRLTTKYEAGLYSHQADAIEAALDGNDVCLATATASGKSIVFMTYAAHLLLNDPNARVIALYPAKALIQDQRAKWNEVLKPLDLQLGFIDGSVPPQSRERIVRSSHVLLMTPDVTHAWLMSHLSQPEISCLMNNLKLLVLDEAHVYEGAFGTNMAYLLRRIEAISRQHQIICCTATIGRPADFLERLTGRTSVRFGLQEDGSYSPRKTLLLVKSADKKPFESTVALVKKLARVQGGRFIAFGDSRKMVESLVAAVHRADKITASDYDIEDTDDEESEAEHLEAMRSDPAEENVLPYRAGYEEDDRTAIQEALTHGTLTGVISTSALELGLDIGEVDLVVLLSRPPSSKAFWQRLGRAGRRRQAVCVLIDSRSAFPRGAEDLEHYLKRELEPSWIYLDNKYIQYAHALCAAIELNQVGRKLTDVPALCSLPDSFSDYVSNEMDPTESVPTDLYPLKQRAQTGPHYEFLLRSSTEQNLRILGEHNRPMGNIAFPQALREAYPGAIYYYMARPFRVVRLRLRAGEITCRSAKYYTTRPLAQAMVFPRFSGGILQLQRSEDGFVAEVELQVSERVQGFVEQRGSAKHEHHYGPTSTYSQREINRFFETTGVCWYFNDPRSITEMIGNIILEAFCNEFGIQEHDLGVGMFHAKQSPLGTGTVQGICIFDSTHGSLRLTEQLANHFTQVVEAALASAHDQEDISAKQALESLATLAASISPVDYSQANVDTDTEDQHWVAVIAPNEIAMYTGDSGTKEARVIKHRYTPLGLVYDLESDRPTITRWTVPATYVQPIHGETRMIRVNLLTDEIEQT